MSGPPVVDSRCPDLTGEGRNRRVARHPLIKSSSQVNPGDLLSPEVVGSTVRAMTKRRGCLRDSDHGNMIIGQKHGNGRPEDGGSRPRPAAGLQPRAELRYSGSATLTKEAPFVCEAPFTTSIR